MTFKNKFYNLLLGPQKMFWGPQFDHTCYRIKGMETLHWRETTLIYDRVYTKGLKLECIWGAVPRKKGSVGLTLLEKRFCGPQFTRKDLKMR